MQYAKYELSPSSVYVLINNYK